MGMICDINSINPSFSTSDWGRMDLIKYLAIADVVGVCVSTTCEERNFFTEGCCSASDEDSFLLREFSIRRCSVKCLYANDAHICTYSKIVKLISEIFLY